MNRILHPSRRVGFLSITPEQVPRLSIASTSHRATTGSQTAKQTEFKIPAARARAAREGDTRMAGSEPQINRIMDEDTALSSEMIEEEKRHFQKIAKAFLYYKWAGLHVYTCYVLIYLSIPPSEMRTPL